MKKIEISQHARYLCTFCGKNSVKRHSTGIWDCKSCKKTVAGGAYVLSYVDLASAHSAPRAQVVTLPNSTNNTYSTPAAAATRSTVRRLREIAEV